MDYSLDIPFVIFSEFVAEFINTIFVRLAQQAHLMINFSHHSSQWLSKS